MTMFSRKPLQRSEWLLFLTPLLMLALIFGVRYFFSAEQQAARIIRWTVFTHKADLDSVDRLAKLGPPAHDLIIAELKTMQQNPKNYRNGRGYVLLFRTAVQARDMRALPYFKHFELDEDKWVRYYASQSRWNLLSPRKRNLTVKRQGAR